MSRCPACGHENQVGARFCSECATPLLETSAGAREERKVVTLVKEGRRSQADIELQLALTFYRSVGASRYVREAEALLSASA